MLKKFWADPVWSKVIAAGILAVVGLAATYLAGWWPPLANVFLSLSSLMVSVTAVPNWLLALLILGAIAVFIVLTIVLWAIAFPSKSSPSFINYTQDEFFGIRWRWRYDGDTSIYNLVSFCPRCDYQVHPRNVSGFRAIDHLGYRCDDCGATLGDFEMSLEELSSRVTRKIHQKIRTGSWLKSERPEGEQTA